jgi:hypothetical protein
MGAFQTTIGQAKCTAMDHKCSVHFAIVRHPITLDKVLETYDVSDGFLDVPNQILVAWYLAFLRDLETAVIACHLESILGLDNLGCKFLVATLIKGHLVI